VISHCRCLRGTLFRGRRGFFPPSLRRRGEPRGTLGAEAECRGGSVTAGRGCAALASGRAGGPGARHNEQRAPMRAQKRAERAGTAGAGPGGEWNRMAPLSGVVPGAQRRWEGGKEGEKRVLDMNKEREKERERHVKKERGKNKM